MNPSSIAPGISVVASIACAVAAPSAHASGVTRESFAAIDLGRPGLEQVKRNVDAGKYDAAASALLAHFRARYAGKAPDYSNSELPRDVSAPPGAATREMADNALQHRFKPHKGYGYFDYGRDINWQIWPVKDNEVRWQLHRVAWWDAMAQMYRSTGDERYAKEWMAQFSDWVRKNPLGLSAENDRYAWRGLEISDRLQSLVPTFATFVGSPNMTPTFLMSFLGSYQQQAGYLAEHFAEQGNHRLFEAQRLLFAGASFPELRSAPSWRKSGISILSAEIDKQVYPDGVQKELSPNYHAAAIDIFLNAYAAAQRAGLAQEFPASYRPTIGKMIAALIDITLPDYNAPMFGDGWIIDRQQRVRQFRKWLQSFPDDQAIRYFATEGREGQPPAHLSRGLTSGGFYTFRSGWTSDATVMILKAGPPGLGGGFHAQPDNGTFELWAHGRNFMPDSGVYVYSGDAEIMKMRNWYRQTRIHNTLTLNDADIRIAPTLRAWRPDGGVPTLSYVNASYDGLKHQRTVLFVDGRFFVIVDHATGDATGQVRTHFALREDSNPTFDARSNSVQTDYADGNNLLIKNLDASGTTLHQEEGKVSYSYRKEVARPAFAFEQKKRDARSRTFVTVLYPYKGGKAPTIAIKFGPEDRFGQEMLKFTLLIDGKERRLEAAMTMAGAPSATSPNR